MRTVAIDSKYQSKPGDIGTGEIVGSGKLAPAAAQGVATQGPDPWGGFKQKYAGVFEPGSAHNNRFREEWAIQQKATGGNPNAHPTPEQAHAIADRIFGGQSEPGSGGVLAGEYDARKKFADRAQATAEQGRSRTYADTSATIDRALTADSENQRKAASPAYGGAKAAAGGTISAYHSFIDPQARAVASAYQGIKNIGSGVMDAISGTGLPQTAANSETEEQRRRRLAALPQ